MRKNELAARAEPFSWRSNVLLFFGMLGWGRLRAVSLSREKPPSDMRGVKLRATGLPTPALPAVQGWEEGSEMSFKKYLSFISLLLRRSRKPRNESQKDHALRLNQYKASIDHKWQCLCKLDLLPLLWFGSSFEFCASYRRWKAFLALKRGNIWFGQHYEKGLWMTYVYSSQLFVRAQELYRQ